MAARLRAEWLPGLRDAFSPVVSEAGQRQAAAGKASKFESAEG